MEMVYSILLIFKKSTSSLPLHFPPLHFRWGRLPLAVKKTWMESMKPEVLCSASVPLSENTKAKANEGFLKEPLDTKEMGHMKPIRFQGEKPKMQ